MRSKEEFERIIDTLPEGETFLVPMASEKEYNSQRVMFYRTLQRMESMYGKSKNIGHGKLEREGQIFLKIFRTESTTTVLKEVNGELVEVSLPDDAKSLRDLKEEKAFNEWLAKIEKAKEDGDLE
jgi:hypothetical protein